MSIRDMVARHSNYDDTKDYIPTPPWATRVLFEEVAPHALKDAEGSWIYDPAAGGGHMMSVFCEYGHSATGSDVEPRDKSITKRDFWTEPASEFEVKPDYIVSNPPYRNIEVFIRQALAEARYGVAMLCRIQVLESQTRHHLFKQHPPTTVAVFSDRIPFKTGEVVRKAPKMFTHCWLWWDKTFSTPPKTELVWIRPDAQKVYEQDADYA